VASTTYQSLINGVALVVNATRRMVAALIFGLKKDDDASLHARAVSAAGAAAAAAAEAAVAAARRRALRMLEACIGTLWEISTQESQEIKVSLGPGRGAGAYTRPLFSSTRALFPR